LLLRTLSLFYTVLAAALIAVASCLLWIILAYFVRSGFTGELLPVMISLLILAAGAFVVSVSHWIFKIARGFWSFQLKAYQDALMLHGSVLILGCIEILVERPEDTLPRALVLGVHACCWLYLRQASVRRWFS
jgi:hypothetical protein